ncbi:MAG: DUF4381 domain-containing protein [Pseudomonadota bacterium]
MDSVSSSVYEGLTLPELLALMHGIVVPSSPGLVPQTAGWWVVITGLLITLLLWATRIIRDYYRNRYRRRALAELEALEKGLGTSKLALGPELAGLTKRTALAAWPRHEVAATQGEDWAAFLIESADNDPLVSAAARGITRAAYDPAIDARALIEGVRQWIQIHRV